MGQSLLRGDGQMGSLGSGHERDRVPGHDAEQEEIERQDEEHRYDDLPDLPEQVRPHAGFLPASTSSVGPYALSSAPRRRRITTNATKTPITAAAISQT